ncbi:MAG: hypothetical protein ACRD8O_18600 [Bryobacteraceae bacterium]
MAKQSLVSNAARFVQTVVPAVLRPLRTLWHEVIGFLFLALAVIGVFSAVRTFQNFKGDGDGFLKLIVTAIFVLIMGGYGISSFRRARKISRS